MQEASGNARSLHVLSSLLTIGPCPPEDRRPQTFLLLWETLCHLRPLKLAHVGCDKALQPWAEVVQEVVQQESFHLLAPPPLSAMLAQLMQTDPCRTVQRKELMPPLGACIWRSEAPPSESPLDPPMPHFPTGRLLLLLVCCPFYPSCPFLPLVPLVPSVPLVPFLPLVPVLPFVPFVPCLPFVPFLPFAPFLHFVLFLPFLLFLPLLPFLPFLPLACDFLIP
mmetsp:Transcript_44783/g.92610  ORF Transcript_44783/g.92610 Transcript_44783/m.92610 type:complete len:223 (+) Transcript_44783:3-671(+)